MKDNAIKLGKMPAVKFSCTVDRDKFDEKSVKEAIKDFINSILSKNMIISEENESGEMGYIFKEIGSVFKAISKYPGYIENLTTMIDNLNSEPEFCIFNTQLGSFIQKIEINYRNFDSKVNKVIERELNNEIKLKYDPQKKFGRLVFDFYEPSIGSDEHITIQRRKAEIIFHTSYNLRLILDEISK